MRKESIDYEKGILVAAMVLCHVLQFFGKSKIYSEQETIMFCVNAHAFEMFLFAYGRSVAVAYLNKPFQKAVPRLLRSCLTSYAAFCISGIGYLVLCGGKDFDAQTVYSVLLLENIPGWSEFLISFAAYALVTILLFPLLKKLIECKKAFWPIWAACFASTLMPYSSISDPRLGILIGTTRFACFPVLQYMPFFLMGLYVEKNGMQRKWLWMLGAAAMSAVGYAYKALVGTPGRFPPKFMWLMLPWFGIALIHFAAQWMENRGRQCATIRKILRPLGSMGANSLYYLLTSNLVIFTLSRLKAEPDGIPGNVFPFGLKHGSTLWALFWTFVLLLAIGFTQKLCKGTSGRRSDAADKSGSEKQEQCNS